MKAWRFYGFNDLRLDDIPAPDCPPGHVVVEPLVVQPSVTEAQLACGIPTLAYDRIKRRLEPEAPIQLFGHEFCARIVEVGRGVTRYRPGDRVAARAKLPCQNCSLCNSGRSALCRTGPVIGFDLPGCFSELALLARNRAGQSRRPHLRQPGRLPAIAQRQRGRGRNGRARTSAIASSCWGKAAWAWNACELPASAAPD